MELKNVTMTFGCKTVEELCKNREKYFSEELEKQTDPWWIGNCSGSRETWRFIGATLEAKGEDIFPIFLAEGYMTALNDEAVAVRSDSTGDDRGLYNDLALKGLSDRMCGFIAGQKSVYKRVLLDIHREDLVNLVDEGKFDPEQYMASMMGR